MKTKSKLVFQEFVAGNEAEKLVETTVYSRIDCLPLVFPLQNGTDFMHSWE